jgi:serine/threonine protein kinase
MNHAISNVSAYDMTATPLPQQTHTGSDNCLDIGTRVAEFEITGIVGEGGFGIVYLAFDHSLQRNIALKEYMPPALAGRSTDKMIAVRSKRHQETFEAGLKSFINEARLLAQFDHPALIKVHRFWEQNNTAYMAMRFYEGRTLKDILKDEPEIATEAWWKSILRPILGALDVLYAVQILHRDISPENIMIQPSGEPVLLDFGAARQLIQNMAQALTVILKPGFAPIEQYADDSSMQQGPWTDIYALAAVVYSGIARKTPPASVARLIKDPMEPLTPEDYPGYSRQFLFAISKGLAVRPEDRPQSIAEFSQLLGLDKPDRRALDRAPAPDAGKVRSKKVRSDSKTTLAEKAVSATASDKNRHPRADSRATSSKVNSAFAYRGWIGGIVGVVCVVAIGLYSFKAGKGVTVSNLPATSVTASDTASASSSATAAVAKPQEANQVPAVVESTAPASSTKQADTPPIIATAQTVNKPANPPVTTPLPRTGTPASKTQQPAIQVTSVAAKETGSVQLLIKPWGNILVNGVSKGASPPLKSLVLPEGKHQIRVVNSHYRDHVVEVEVAGQRTVKIEHDFSRVKK